MNRINIAIRTILEEERQREINRRKFTIIMTSPFQYSYYVYLRILEDRIQPLWLLLSLTKQSFVFI